MRHTFLKYLVIPSLSIVCGLSVLGFTSPVNANQESCSQTEVFGEVVEMGAEPQCYENLAEIECAIAGTLPVAFTEWPLPKQTCANVDGEPRPIEMGVTEEVPPSPASENLIFSWSEGDAFGLMSATEAEKEGVNSAIVEPEELQVGGDSILTPTSTLAAEGTTGMKVLADNEGNPIKNPSPLEFSDVEFTNVGSLENVPNNQKADKIINGEGESIQGDQDSDGNIVAKDAGGGNSPIGPDPPNDDGGNLEGGNVADGLDEWGGLMDGVLRTEGGILGFIAELIRWALGLLGTIFFVITLAAGFMYMTAGGDTQKVSSAIGLVKNAIVGLVIISGSYLITEYVISAVLS